MHLPPGFRSEEEAPSSMATNGTVKKGNIPLFFSTCYVISFLVLKVRTEL